jgi:hypothetical protein
MLALIWRFYDILKLVSNDYQLTCTLVSLQLVPLGTP